jgi:hypothetical protein
MFQSMYLHAVPLFETSNNKGVHLNTFIYKSQSIIFWDAA